jgi:hypothetical protein
VLSEQVRNRSFHEEAVIQTGEDNNPALHDLGWVDDPFEEEQIYDNSHLSTEGHKVLADALYKHLQGHKLVDNSL